MRSVEEQLALITAAAVTPEPVRIAISEALGLRCAEQVEGTSPIPGFDQAAIDGFAVRSVDVRQAFDVARRNGAPAEDSADQPADIVPQDVRPVLPIVGEVTAGSHRPVPCSPGRLCACTPVRHCPLWPMP